MAQLLQSRFWSGLYFDLIVHCLVNGMVVMSGRYVGRWWAWETSITYQAVRTVVAIVLERRMIVSYGMIMLVIAKTRVVSTPITRMIVRRLKLYRHCME